MGKLDAKKSSVGTGLVGAPACGDVMKLQVRNPNILVSLSQTFIQFLIYRLK